MNAERVEDFIEALWQSRLVDLDLLGGLARGGEAGGRSPGDLAAELVDRGVLTPFQAERCLAGDGRGLKLGPYRFLGLLGEGALGRVYRARHETSGRVVAVKVLHPEALADPGAAHRFHREAEAARWLSHPNLVRVLDDGLQDGAHYLVMEHVEGVALDRFLDREGPLDVPDACRLARHVALALQCMVARGFVPSDVRPSDLIVGERAGSIKLLAAGQGRLGAGARDLGEFEFGPLLDADFDPPDDASSAAAAALREDVRSALLGLGRELLRMLDGGAERPPALALVLARMTAEDPSGRYETPEECARALAPFCGPEPEVPEPIPPVPAPEIEGPEWESLPEPARDLPGPPAVLPAEAPAPSPTLAAPRPRRRAGSAALFLVGAAFGSALTMLAPPLLRRLPPMPTPTLLALAPTSKPLDPPAKPPEPIEEPAPIAPVEPPAAPVVEPAVDKPAEPVLEKPIEPVQEKPVEPVQEKPVEPVAEKPIEPVVEKPAEPVVEKPAEAEAPAAGEYVRLLASGDRELNNNRVEEAIALYGQAIRRKPDMAAAYLRRAEGLNRTERRREAVADCNQALALNPRDAAAFRLRASALINLGDAGGALADADRAIALDPRDAVSYNTRGVAHFIQGQSAEAVRDLAESVRIDENLANPQGNLAWVLANASDRSVRNGPMAVKHATNACLLTRWSDPTQLNNLAAAYGECGAFDRAAHYQGLALRSSQNLPARTVEQYEARLKQYLTKLGGREPTIRPLVGGVAVDLSRPPRANPAVPPPPPPVPATGPSSRPPPPPVPAFPPGSTRPRPSTPPAGAPIAGRQAAADRPAGPSSLPG